jgi:putative transposase
MAYRHLFKDALSDGRLVEIRLSVRQQCALGTSRFQREIEAIIGRCASVRAANRPRRNRAVEVTGSEPL